MRTDVCALLTDITTARFGHRVCSYARNAPRRRSVLVFTPAIECSGRNARFGRVAFPGHSYAPGRLLAEAHTGAYAAKVRLVP